MSFYLELDKENFRKHLTTTKRDFENLIPVIKGNGYGFGIEHLAKEANDLNCDVICVGTIFEAAAVASVFKGRILVLEPFNTADRDASNQWQDFDKRFIRTISSISSGFKFDAPYVIEGRVSTNRFGLSKAEISDLELNNAQIEGLALHLAINQSDEEKLKEIAEWLEIWKKASANKTIWLSHVSKNLLNKIRNTYPELKINVRVGTELWLGDKSFLSAKGVVLGVIEGVSKAGYSQKKLSKNIKIIVVSGGTANGLGLNSDISIKKFADRLRVFLAGLLGTFGKYQSSFLINGKKAYLFEPTHMNVSLLQVPRNEKVNVGEVLDAKVRYSTSKFDFIK